MIALAGALGALSRWGVEQVFPAAADGTNYVGTLAVNVTGAFALGIATALLADRHGLLRPAVTIGFLSAYTTFSALSLQTYRLLDGGRPVLAAALSLGSLATGLTAVYLGLLAGRTF